MGHKSKRVACLLQLSVYSQTHQLFSSSKGMEGRKTGTKIMVRKGNNRQYPSISVKPSVKSNYFDRLKHKRLIFGTGSTGPAGKHSSRPCSIEEGMGVRRIEVNGQRKRLAPLV